MDNREREKVVPSFEILLNGNRIPAEAQNDVFHLEVVSEVNAIGMCTVSLNAGDPKTGDVKWLDTDLFKEGSELKIKAGFHAPLSDLFLGDVTALEPDFPAKGAMSVVVRAYDRLHRLGYGRRSRSFKNMKLSDVVSQVAQDWSLTAEVDDTGVTHEYLFQNNQSDLAFLLERASRIGYEVAVDSKRLFFRRSQETKSKVSTLSYGQNLYAFAPRMSLRSQIEEVTVRAWNDKDGKVMESRAGAGDETSRMGGSVTGAATVGQVLGNGKGGRVVVEDIGESVEELEHMARGRFNTNALGWVMGEGSCFGEPQIGASKVVDIQGLGKRFSGLYYVKSATHAISVKKGYTTFFTAHRTAI